MSTEDPHAPLREDVRLLGDLLGKTIREQAGEEVFNNVETIRQLSKAAISGDERSREALISALQNLPLEHMIPVTKAFSQFLNFANIAEQYHRVRRTKWYESLPEQAPQAGSLKAVLPMLKSKGISNDSLYQAICRLDIQLVLTAHPTEVKRRTVMSKYDKIASALQTLDRVNLTLSEQKQVTETIHQEMTAVWQTPEIRWEKPTAIDEAKWGFAVIESSLWQAVPDFIRDLDQVVQQETGQALPINFMPIRFDSWMGGDRDGNPNVTPNVTRQVCLMARWVAADLLISEIISLRDTLSMTACNDTLRSVVGEDAVEPYRAILKTVKKRLNKTKDWLKATLEADFVPFDPEVYMQTSEVLEPLLVCHQSLIDCGASILANGHLLDVIRQINCFGLSLVRIDIRQEASKHSELMSDITEELGLGRYDTWQETERQAFLVREIQSKRPLIPHHFSARDEVLDTLNTFKVIATLPRDSLGSYIISMAATASDVLLVLLLQREAGIQEFLPVVPLFETLADLEGAPLVLDALLNIPCYRQLVNNYQQIMIGYSDSAKDAGLLAATWAQYTAQEQLTEIAAKYETELVFFHGRGGTIGRGGWPTHASIRSQPPGSIHGVIRVTQQGEVIKNRFGIPDIAKRTLSVYTTATLEASLIPSPVPEAAWRALMIDLSRVSASHYRAVVEENTDFSDYFITATPTKELGNLAIGSRPQQRNQNKSLSSLRAIPWIFAWTQNRLLLPSWIGVGEALKYALNTSRENELKTMTKEWPFFHSMLSMCEMVLAKADPDISSHYEHRLVSKNLLKLGESLRTQFGEAESVLLQVLEQQKLLSKNPVLDRSIQVRSTYLLPLHLLQVELLYRTRNNQQLTHEKLRQALLVSIAGIAAGMRNTG